MCGISGLFVGCPLEETCVKSQIVKRLKSMSTDYPGKSEYKSYLKNWDTAAGVRSRPHRQLDNSEPLTKSYFSRDFVPISKHAEICALEKTVQEEILTQHLYRYLRFTSVLEHVVVNNVAMAIAQDCLSVDLPEEMIFDAYKLYCDEAYHAYFSIDLLRQVQHQSGITPKLLRWPNFVIKLREIQHQMPNLEAQKLVEIFFVIVSETLISGTLVGLPQEESVVTAVRDIVRDHSLDEGKHHQYFASLLRILWPKLTTTQKKTVGPILPQLIFNFLTPDVDSITHELQTYKLSNKKIEQIIAETYPPKMITEYTKRASKVTLRHFEVAGVFEEPFTNEAFQKSGLI